MREIKFRAWDIMNKTWVQPLSSAIIDYIGIGYALDDRNGRLIFVFYTGLKDSKGHEIYEGDIIKTPQGDFAKVIYDEEYAFFTPEFKAGVRCASFISYHPWLCEVIGNIYENPELLK